MNLLIIPYNMENNEEIIFKTRFNAPKNQFKYVNGKNINELISKEDVYKSPYFVQSIMKTNPYGVIGQSVFRYLESIIIANIDAIIDMTYHIGGNFAQNTYTGKGFNFVDINGAPGGFSQYIMWRIVDSRGNGISLRNYDNYPLWNKNVLELIRQFYIFEGTDHSGNITTNIESLSNWLGIDTQCGLKMITSRLTPKSFEKYIYTNPEEQIVNISSAKDIETLIATLIFAIMRLCPTEGSLLIELPNMMENIIVEIIYLMTIIFQEVYLMKPVSSPLHTSIVYLVAKKLRSGDKSEIVLRMLIKILNEVIKKGKKLTGILSNELTEDFLNWLNSINNTFLSLQLEVINNAEKHINFLKENDPDNRRKDKSGKSSCPEEETALLIRQINRVRLLGAWNIPDAPRTMMC